jgi:acyl-CoA reductase-like NAD-dependent aldehyde dehydrogenase
LAINVTDTRLVTEEVFGPILTVQSFKDEEEAIKFANDTAYGLSAYVYSGNQKRAQRVASQIKAGQVSINGVSYLTDHAPFGGYKDSGIGRGSGKYGFYESTQMKVIARPKS